MNFRHPQRAGSRLACPLCLAPDAAGLAMDCLWRRQPVYRIARNSRGRFDVKLICYRLKENSPVTVRPAPATRDWMDDTPGQHANRCLPLAIANASGWEILNPHPFSAVWNGREGQDAVRIKGEGGTLAAESHFGSGVLTFRIPGLFVTEPGVMLWVGGSPNLIKDGIQPLTGLVETAWSPFTFTMNWKFTRTRTRIRFEKDEPFCFIFPVNPDLLVDAMPEHRALDDDPELAAMYRKWKKSRKKFNADIKKPGSLAQFKGWQRFYHHGAKPDGTNAGDEHRTKMKLRAFAARKKPRDD